MSPRSPARSAVLLAAGLLIALAGCQAPAASPSAAKPPAAGSSGSAPPTAAGASGGPAAATTAPAAKPAAPPSGTPDQVRMSDARVLATAPVYVALEKGYFREQNIELTLESSAGAADVVPFLATGDLDIALGATTVGLFNAYDRGADIKIIAPAGIMTLEDSPLPLVVRKDLVDSGQVRGPADLRGRKVAMNTRGASPEYILSKIMEGVGLTVHDLDLVTVPFPDMPAALSNGSIDAAVAAEPAATRAVSLGVGVKLVKEVVPGRMTTAIIASGKMLRERPEVVQRLLLAYMKGIREIQPPAIGTYDPEKFYRPDILAIFEKYTGTPEAVLRSQVPYTFDVDLVIQGDSLMDQQAVHMRNGTLTLAQPIPLERLVDDSFARYAQQTMGRLRP
jgi:NitT/TauT family transport system substrate-binding protein